MTNIAFDVSPAIYGTGVSDYITSLVSKLPNLRLFGYSLRRRFDLQTMFPGAKTFPFPPTVMDYLWNRCHVLPVETLIGPVDIYHSSDWAQAPSKAKKITTVHDLAPFLYPQEHDSQIVTVQAARMKWVTRECDAVICVSENTAADFQRLFNYPGSRIHVIPEALPDRFVIKPQITSYQHHILAIGARQPRKNIVRLISAYQNFKSTLNLPEKLIIVGEKPISNFKFQISNSVEFTGYISDQRLVNLLASASVFVYPSLYEGFGLPVLVAFYHQVPVAAADTSSLPEVAGNAAVLFDPYNEEAMAAAMAEAIKNRDELIRLGTKQLAGFSWAATAARTRAVYDSLL